MDKIEKICMYLEHVEPYNKVCCKNLLMDNKERLLKSPGSFSKHHAWEGGYLDHVIETMEIAEIIYNATSKKRGLDFTLGDVILILFIHDLEKPFKYSEPKVIMETDSDKELFIESLLSQYDFELGDKILRAFQLIHGEGRSFSKTKRAQSPLSAFCHICDTFSARIWWNYPEH